MAKKSSTKKENNRRKKNRKPTAGNQKFIRKLFAFETFRWINSTSKLYRSCSFCSYRQQYWCNVVTYRNLHVAYPQSVYHWTNTVTVKMTVKTEVTNQSLVLVSWNKSLIIIYIMGVYVSVQPIFLHVISSVYVCKCVKMCENVWKCVYMCLCVFIFFFCILSFPFCY